MEIIQDNGAVYHDWIAAHGSVVNGYRNPGAAYLVLHTADCFHFQRWEGRTHTRGDHAKSCCGSQQELHDWGQVWAGR